MASGANAIRRRVMVRIVFTSSHMEGASIPGRAQPALNARPLVHVEALSAR
jgi:hypothetical protein